MERESAEKRLKQVSFYTIVSYQSLFLLSPFDRIKTLYQCQSEMAYVGRLIPPYTSLYDCCKRTLMKEGYISLWRGSSVLYLRKAITAAGLLSVGSKGAYQVQGTPQANRKSITTSIIHGGVPGAVLQAITYPFTYSYTRMACDIIPDQGKYQFKGHIDVWKKTLSADGAAGIFRALPISMFSIFLYRGLYFGIYEQLDAHLLPLSPRIAVSYTITCIASLATYPCEVLRSRMMIQSGNLYKYPNTWIAARNILRNEGPRAFYKGFTLHIFGAIFGTLFLVSIPNAF